MGIHEQCRSLTSCTLEFRFDNCRLLMRHLEKLFEANSLAEDLSNEWDAIKDHLHPERMNRYDARIRTQIQRWKKLQIRAANLFTAAVNLQKYLLSPASYKVGREGFDISDEVWQPFNKAIDEYAG